MTTILLYLLETSVYLLVFALAYRFLFSHLTHFSWMRGYLIGSVLLSLGLPLLPTPSMVLTFWGEEATAWQPTFNLLFTPTESVTGAVQSEGAGAVGLPWTGVLLWLLGVVYGAGVLYKTYGFLSNMYMIVRLVASHPKQWEGEYWKVRVSYEWPAFTFLHYIFLGTHTERLTLAEQQCVIAHEREHVRQGHTYDRLLLEVVGIFFWFHPLMRYLQQQLQEVQEYLADRAISGQGSQQKQYAHLLLKLATEAQPVSLASGITGKQIGRRIAMLSKPRSSPQNKWQFALILPLAVGLFLLSSCLDESSPEVATVGDAETHATMEAEEVRIRQIRWEGNTRYDDATLTDALTLKPGDTYDSLRISESLNYNPDGGDVPSLYMDQGYLFFNIKVEKQEVGEGMIDLVMKINEGETIQIGDILIRGNQGVSEQQILEEIPFKQGALFNRSELIAAQKAIADMGYFDPEQVGINPIPHPEQGTVDIEFVLIPKQ
ncbi:MAG: POTRA domain-containing protein [Cyclobacteriaceae bacterium]